MVEGCSPVIPAANSSVHIPLSPARGRMEHSIRVTRPKHWRVRQRLRDMAATLGRSVFSPSAWRGCFYPATPVDIPDSENRIKTRQTKVVETNGRWSLRVESILCGRSVCRSELAREERKDTELNQDARVIVDVLREQARSYKGRIRLAWLLPTPAAPAPSPPPSNPHH